MSTNDNAAQLKFLPQLSIASANFDSWNETLKSRILFRHNLAGAQIRDNIPFPSLPPPEPHYNDMVLDLDGVTSLPRYPRQVPPNYVAPVALVPIPSTRNKASFYELRTRSIPTPASPVQPAAFPATPATPAAPAAPVAPAGPPAMFQSTYDAAYFQLPLTDQSFRAHVNDVTRWDNKVAALCQEDSHLLSLIQDSLSLDSRAAVEQSPLYLVSPGTCWTRSLDYYRIVVQIHSIGDGRHKINRTLKFFSTAQGT